ncbi:MAG: hypothetical protein N2035_08985 [Chthoniobacterales bacterium]|nr:hypothetical protein [Chthoniobacterales bacterium]
MLSIARAISVPLGMADPARLHIASTFWRTASLPRSLTYVFDSATFPSVFWVNLKKIPQAEGEKPRKLTLVGPKFYSGGVSAAFELVEPFVPLGELPTLRGSLT